MSMRLFKKAPPVRRLSLVIGGEGETGALHDELAEASRAGAENDTNTDASPDAVDAAADAFDTVQSAYEIACREGFDKGYQEGREAGYLTGFEEGKAQGQDALRAELERGKADLDALLSALTRPLGALNDELIASLTDGAMTLARLLIEGVLEADPTALAGIVNDIVREAKEAGAPNNVLRLHVPATSFEAVKALAEPYGAEVRMDENLNDGDILADLSRVNGDPVQVIEWDARLKTRWDAIRKTLKR
jgi:flagellar biosynthesis/type III secretory pathway protein FliH